MFLINTKNKNFITILSYLQKKKKLVIMIFFMILERYSLDTDLDTRGKLYLQNYSRHCIFIKQFFRQKSYTCTFTRN